MTEPIQAQVLPQTLSTTLLRGLRERCPKCGDGKLFQAYLKPKEACPVCHENFVGIRADDGPAWLTIILMGHISVPVAIYLAMSTALPAAEALTILLAFTSGATLLILPHAKGIFFALVWRNRQKPAKAGRWDILLK